MIDRQKVGFDHIWNLKRHKSKDFNRVMILIEGVDYVFVQYYFGDEERYINIAKQHGNSKTNTKSYIKMLYANHLLIQKVSSQISIENLDILLSVPLVTFQEIISKYLILDTPKSHCQN